MNRIERSKEIPLPNEGTVTKEDRLAKGKEVQLPLYGESLKQNMKDLPGEFAEAIPRMANAIYAIKDAKPEKDVR